MSTSRNPRRKPEAKQPQSKQQQSMVCRESFVYTDEDGETINVHAGETYDSDDPAVVLLPGNFAEAEQS